MKWIAEIKHDFNASDEDLLKSALLQYQNHIQGMFNLRKGEREMAKVMSDFLLEKLEIDKDMDSSNKIDKISVFKEYVYELLKYLDEASDKCMFEALEIFEKQICGSCPSMVIEKGQFNLKFGEIGSSIIFKPTDWNNQYYMCLEFEGKLSKLFFGIKNVKGDSQENVIKEIMNKFTHSEKGNQWWPYWIWIQENYDNKRLIEDVNNDLCERIKGIATKTYGDTSDVIELLRCDSNIHFGIK